MRKPRPMSMSISHHLSRTLVALSILATLLTGCHLSGADPHIPPAPSPAPTPAPVQVLLGPTTVTTVTTVPMEVPAPAPPEPIDQERDPRVTQMIEIADLIPAESFNWRTLDPPVQMLAEFAPAPECCHWGTYDFHTHTLWIGPTAFASTTILHYVILHELGHAWQYSLSYDRLDRLRQDFQGLTSIPPLEASADCLAKIWAIDTGQPATAPHGAYWDCPAPALQLTRQELSEIP